MEVLAPYRETWHRRVSRIRPRPALTAAGAVIAIVAAGTIASYLGSTPVGRFAADGSSTTAPPGQRADLPTDGSCPDSFDVGNGAPVETETGPLVPGGAVGATLCTYWSEQGGDVMPLASSQALPGDAGDLVSHLNGLPARAPGDDLALGGDRWDPTVCALARRPAYRIVLVYTGQPAAIVDVPPNCGAASRGGVVRNLSTLTGLLAFWPAPTPAPS